MGLYKSGCTESIRALWWSFCQNYVPKSGHIEISGKQIKVILQDNWPVLRNVKVKKDKDTKQFLITGDYKKI